MLERNGNEISMIEIGEPYENALAKRMNRTIKEEFLGDARFMDQWVLGKVARESIAIYNKERLHLKLGMRLPDQVHR
ncbi:MAG: transposase [Ignavibacteria bacterium]|nr:transposase [Ignavibacteria bacterium]